MDVTTPICLLALICMVIDKITSIENAIYPHTSSSLLADSRWSCEKQAGVNTYKLTNCAIWCKNVECDIFALVDGTCITCTKGLHPCSSSQDDMMPVQPVSMYGEHVLYYLNIAI